MWFYGAIEQLLSGWVFDLIPGGEADFDRAREMLVETICGGLEARNGAGRVQARRCGSRSARRLARIASAWCGESAERGRGFLALPMWLVGQRLSEPFRRRSRGLDPPPATCRSRSRASAPWTP